MLLNEILNTFKGCIGIVQHVWASYHHNKAELIESTRLLLQCGSNASENTLIAVPPETVENPTDQDQKARHF